MHIYLFSALTIEGIQATNVLEAQVRCLRRSVRWSSVSGLNGI